MLGYTYSPRVLAHDPPPSTLQIAGQAFPLGNANVAQAVLTAQAHELVERSALSGSLERIAFEPAPYEALLAAHTAEYLDRLREACDGGPWDGEHAPVTPATSEAARLTVGGVLAAVRAAGQRQAWPLCHSPAQRLGHTHPRQRRPEHRHVAALRLASSRTADASAPAGRRPRPCRP